MNLSILTHCCVNLLRQLDGKKKKEIILADKNAEAKNVEFPTLKVF